MQGTALNNSLLVFNTCSLQQEYYVDYWTKIIPLKQSEGGFLFHLKNASYPQVLGANFMISN